MPIAWIWNHTVVRRHQGPRKGYTVRHFSGYLLRDDNSHVRYFDSWAGCFQAIKREVMQ